MELSEHNVQALLLQLGIGSAVDDFIATHPLAPGVALGEAPFWSPAQADFINKAHDEDAQWSGAVDELAARLS